VTGDLDGRHLSPPQMPAPGGAADQGGRGDVSRLATAEELLASAMWHTRHFGWAIFPTQVDGKRPVPVHSFKDAVTNEVRLGEWWHGRAFNPAASTGWPSGPDVLDVDVRPDGNGWAALNQLKEAGLLSGAHRMVRTPSGGLHVYFAGTTQRCGSLKGLFIDFKAGGGYILLPPGHVGGQPYEVVDDRPLTGVTFNWQAAKQLLCPPRPLPMRAGSYRHGPGSARHLVSWLEGEIEGNRNSGLFWACCRALEAGDEEVVSGLTDVALSAGLPEAEVNRTIGSAYRKVSGDDW
jgi:hypothetical protein